MNDSLFADEFFEAPRRSGYFFDPVSGGFYREGIHAQIPPNSIAVSDEQHAALMEAQSQGKRVAVVDGAVVAVLPPPASRPPVERKTVNERLQERIGMNIKELYKALKAEEQANV